MLSSFLASPDFPWEVRKSLGESNRFGLSIGRVDLPFGTSVKQNEIREIIHSSGHDLVILRYPVERWDLAAGLQHQDFVTWQADTLLYFGKEKLEANATAVEGVLVLAAEQSAQIQQVVRQTFVLYGSHYMANPTLDPKAVIDGYVDWAMSFLYKPNSCILGEMNPDQRSIIWFCTLSIDGRDGEIVLGGVSPNTQGQGMYLRLLRSAESWIQKHAVDRAVISTQAFNGTVIRSWIRNGYNYLGSLNTLHIMPRLVFMSRRPTPDDIATTP